jgi:hypothetical protein
MDIFLTGTLECFVMQREEMELLAVRNPGAPP